MFEQQALAQIVSSLDAAINEAQQREDFDTSSACGELVDIVKHIAHVTSSYNWLCLESQKTKELRKEEQLHLNHLAALSKKIADLHTVTENLSSTSPQEHTLPETDRDVDCAAQQTISNSEPNSDNDLLQEIQELEDKEEQDLAELTKKRDTLKCLLAEKTAAHREERDNLLMQNEIIASRLDLLVSKCKEEEAQARRNLKDRAEELRGVQEAVEDEERQIDGLRVAERRFAFQERIVKAGKMYKRLEEIKLIQNVRKIQHCWRQFACRLRLRRQQEQIAADAQHADSTAAMGWEPQLEVPATPTNKLKQSPTAKSQRKPPTSPTTRRTGPTKGSANSSQQHRAAKQVPPSQSANRGGALTSSAAPPRTGRMATTVSGKAVQTAHGSSSAAAP